MDEVARPKYLERLKGKKGKGKEAVPDRLQDAIEDMLTERELPGVDGAMTTPDRPQSSASLKRKRGTPTPRKQATYGRKKQKDGHDILAMQSRMTRTCPTVSRTWSSR